MVSRVSDGRLVSDAVECGWVPWGDHEPGSGRIYPGGVRYDVAPPMEIALRATGPWKVTSRVWDESGKRWTGWRLLGYGATEAEACRLAEDHQAGRSQ